MFQQLRSRFRRLRTGRRPVDLATSMYVALSGDRTFHGKTLGPLARIGWESVPCAFAPSTGRAGSMQLAALLELSPRLLALHEPSPTGMHLARTAYRAEGNADVFTWMVRGMRDEFVAYAVHTGRIYVETNNKLSFLLPALGRAYPSARFLHLHRHPYEVIRSGLARGWYADGPMDFSLITPCPGDAYANRWECMTLVERIAWFWAATNARILSFLATLPVDRRMDLPAEALFTARVDTLAKLFTFVGAQVPPEAQMRKLLRSRMNASRTRSNTKVEWTTREEQMAQPIVRGVAQSLGYSL